MLQRATTVSSLLFKSTSRFQVPPEQYEANLRKIVERIRQETGAVVLFATSTPMLGKAVAAFVSQNLPSNQP
jgi:predicted NodU family carbamoyl transferase